VEGVSERVIACASTPPGSPPGEVPGPEGPDRASTALRDSVAPTFGYNVGSQVLTFGFGVVLARLLRPEDFGLLGMALVFTNVAAVLGNLGLAKALIQAAAVSEAQRRAVFTLSLAVSLVAGMLVVVFSRPIGDFFGNRVVSDLMWLMALNFVLNGAGTVPYAMMNRALNLRELARIDPMATVAGGIASVSLALAGAGVWSLVIGILVASATRLAFYHAHTRWIPRPGFAFGQARNLARYGLGVTGSSFFTTLTTNVDFLLIGRLLSPFALGIYMRALRLVTMPQIQFSMVVVRLLFPYFARIQDDVGRIRRNLLRVVGTSALIAVPALILLFIVARDFVQVVYGPKWLAAVVPLRILCAAGIVRSLSALAGPPLDALGYVRAQAVLQGGYAVLMLGGVVYAARWGINGVAGALGIASLLLGVALLLLLLRVIDLSMRQLAGALLPGLLAAAALTAASGAVYALYPAEGSPALRLLLAILLGLGSAAFALEGGGLAKRHAFYGELRTYAARLATRGGERPAPVDVG
jgi:O-antigen/teichoic acid export membrane protein